MFGDVAFLLLQDSIGSQLNFITTREWVIEKVSLVYQPGFSTVLPHTTSYNIYMKRGLSLGFENDESSVMSQELIKKDNKGT